MSPDNSVCRLVCNKTYMYKLLLTHCN